MIFTISVLGTVLLDTVYTNYTVYRASVSSGSVAIRAPSLCFPQLVLAAEESGLDLRQGQEIFFLAHGV
jgi:hypothetical protein